MGIPLQIVLAEFPKNRQEKIGSAAEKYIREYENHVVLQKDLGSTLEEIVLHNGKS